MKPVFQQLAWQGIVGCILLLFAANFNQHYLAPLEAQYAARLKQQEDDATLLKHQVTSAERQLIDVLATLPNQQEALDTLAKIYLIAEATGVTYQQAQYQWQASSGHEYRVILPVRSAYKNLRYFISRILAENPTVSLDQLSFRRETINDNGLQAEIHLTVFLKP